MNEDIVIDGFRFFEGKGGHYLSGVEICRRLEYLDPAKQASRIWLNNIAHLEEDSVLSDLGSTDGKIYSTRTYNEVGIIFFIAQSQMPLAKDVTLAVSRAFVELKRLYLEGKFSQKTTQRFLLPNPAKPKKAIHDEFYIEIYRVKGWKWEGMHVNRRWECSHITNRWLYRNIDHRLVPEFDKLNPKDKNGNRKYKNHDFLNSEAGLPAFGQMQFGLILLLGQCQDGDWKDFEKRAKQAFPLEGQQLDLFFSELE